MLQVTSDDGAVLACSLNATCFAMIDAGLPMVRVFMAVSAAITSDGEVLIDPTREEEEAAEARVCVALEGNAKRPGPAGDLASEAMIITSWSSGRLTQEMFFHVVGLCRKAQAVMEGFARKSLEQYYDRKTTP